MPNRRKASTSPQILDTTKATKKANTIKDYMSASPQSPEPTEEAAQMDLESRLDRLYQKIESLITVKLTEQEKILKALQESMNFQSKDIQELKEKNDQLTTLCGKQQQEIDQLTGETNKLSRNLIDVQTRQMAPNVVIHGIPGLENESASESEAKIVNFMKNDLKIPQDERDAIKIQVAHRFGKPRPGQPRPMVIRVEKGKDRIFQYVRNLAGTKFSVQQQYPPEILDRRKTLFPIMRNNKLKGKRCKLVADRLYIDGVLYVPT